MSSAGEDESDAVLSDVDEPVQASLSVGDVSLERFREELDREKKARLAAERSKKDLQVSFNRLKSEIKKRDESNPIKEEASREVEMLTNELAELHHTLDKLRAESSVLEDHLEAQAKDLTRKNLRIEELEDKERAENENISALKQEIEEAKQTMIELERKLKFKEETAMAAREAADNSLRLADMRSSRLRDRVEELSHQLDEVNTRDDTHQTRNRPRYVCWPWEWLGVDFAGLGRIEPPLQQHGSNEMELSEPLI